MAAPPAVAQLVVDAAISPPDERLAAIRADIRAGRLTLADAMWLLSANDAASLAEQHPELASSLRQQSEQRRAYAAAVRSVVRGGQDPSGLPWPWAAAGRVLRGEASDDALAVAVAAALAAELNVGMPTAGRLRPMEATALVVLALGEQVDAPGFGFAQWDAAARARLRQWLVRPEAASGEVLGRAVARGAERTGNLRTLLVGIAEAPELVDGARKNEVIATCIHELARLDFGARHRWEGAWATQVKPWLLELLVEGAPVPRRAAATFGVWRAEALGHPDALAFTIIDRALANTTTRLTVIGEAHELYRFDPDAARPILQRAGEEPPSFAPTAPWDLEDRLWVVAQNFCGPMDRPVDDTPPPVEPPDPKQEKLRQIIRDGTEKILATIRQHKGPLPQSLSYRRCEAWLKRMDVEAPGSDERALAHHRASDCLAEHVKRFPEHGPAALEHARMLDDAGKAAEARRWLLRLWTSEDERTRVLASYRLLKHINPADVGVHEEAEGGWPVAVPLDVAAAAAELVATRGFNPHQRIYATLIRGWLDARGGAPRAGLRRIIGLFSSLYNADGRTVRFADTGGLIDYASQLSLLAQVPASELVGVYSRFPDAVRLSAYVQLAQLHARYGRSDQLDVLSKAIESIPGGRTNVAARVLLLEARLREYGPVEHSGGEQRFDARSARAALNELDALASLGSGARSTAASTGARCVFVGYADGVAATLAETGQLDQARTLVRRALALADAERKPGLLLRLATLEELAGDDREAVRRYRQAFTAQPVLARENPLRVLDYYQAAFRSGADRQHATSLVTELAPAIAEAAVKSGGKTQTETLDALAAVLSHEKSWTALGAVATWLRGAGQVDAADAACLASAEGRLTALGALKGPVGLGDAGACTPVAALPGPSAPMETLAPLIDEGLACARDPERRWRLVSIGTVGYAADGRWADAVRLLGEAARTPGLSGRVPAAIHRLGWWALLSGDPVQAEALLLQAGTPQARTWAGIVALSTGRTREAVERLDKANGLGALWEARAKLAAGDIDGWADALRRLSADQERGVALALGETDRVAAVGAGPAAERAWALWDEWKATPAAAHRVALRAARQHMADVLQPALAARFDTPAKAAAGYRTAVGPAVTGLVQKLEPILKHAEPDATALLGAVGLMVRALDGATEYLAAHEGIRGRGSRQWARQAAEELSTLDVQALELGRAALAAAGQRAYSDRTLVELTETLAWRYPETFGLGRRWAMLCRDERSLDLSPASVQDPLAAGLGALMTNGGQLAARAVAAECLTPESGSTDGLALRFAMERRAGGDARTISALARALLDRRTAGAALDNATLLGMAEHLAGVDCETSGELTAAAAQAGAEVPGALRRSVAACGKSTPLREVLATAEPDGPRRWRRQSELVEAFAETEADANEAGRLIRETARALESTPREARLIPVCSVPVLSPTPSPPPSPSPAPLEAPGGDPQPPAEADEPATDAAEPPPIPPR